MPQSFSCDSPINRLRGGIVIAEPFLRVCICRNVYVWESETITSLQMCCMHVSEHMLAWSAYVCACQLHACVPACVHVDACLCVCVCRLEELWRVGFMSQQVTDDQIN